MRKNWWKILCVIILLYTIIGGFLIDVPRLDIVNESIRNVYFHVPMWFGMTLMFGVSLVYAIKYLNKGRIQDDIYSKEFVNVGILFGCLGMVTGMEWANFTWGKYWSNDPKQLMSALSLLIYFAYAVLRNSVNDPDKRGRISAVYNIFAFFIMIPLIFVIPKLTDSLHPGNGGNPAFGDMAPEMRKVFWPAVIGWNLLGVWIAELQIRISLLKNKKFIAENND